MIVDKDKRGLFSYLRYNCWIDAPTLEPLTGKKYTKEQIDDLVEMSNADGRFELYDIGVKVAASQVDKTHFTKKVIEEPVPA